MISSNCPTCNKSLILECYYDYAKIFCRSYNAYIFNHYTLRFVKDIDNLENYKLLSEEVELLSKKIYIISKYINNKLDVMDIYTTNKGFVKISSLKNYISPFSKEFDKLLLLL